MNKDITLEDLGWQEIEPFGVFKKTYRKLDEIVENEEELKEIVKTDKKLRFVYIDFTDLLGKTIDINIQEVNAKIENNEILVEKLGKTSKIANAQISLSMDELQAIYNKCKEIGWLDDLERGKNE